MENTKIHALFLHIFPLVFLHKQCLKGNFNYGIHALRYTLLQKNLGESPIKHAGHGSHTVVQMSSAGHDLQSTIL